MKGPTAFEKIHQAKLLGKLTLPDRILFRRHLKAPRSADPRRVPGVQSRVEGDRDLVHLGRAVGETHVGALGHLLDERHLLRRAERTMRCSARAVTSWNPFGMSAFTAAMFLRTLR
jgi:hypothetical protein